MTAVAHEYRIQRLHDGTVIIRFPATQMLIFEHELTIGYRTTVLRRGMFEFVYDVIPKLSIDHVVIDVDVKGDSDGR